MQFNYKCIFTHFYGLELNLASAESINSNDCQKRTFEIGQEIYMLVKKSPKRKDKKNKYRRPDNCKDNVFMHFALQDGLFVVNLLNLF